jgi:hypothetical protein
VRIERIERRVFMGVIEVASRTPPPLKSCRDVPGAARTIRNKRPRQ